MHIDKKVLKSLFILAGSCILLVWLLLYTEQVSGLFAYIWKLISPFVVGAGIAFVFNVPMRAIERQLEGIRKPGLRRILAILLTLGALILILAFVVELLIPQIQSTVESLTVTIPLFVKKQAANFLAFLEEHPELEEWVLANTDLENIDWTSLLQRAGGFVGDSMSTIVDSTFSAIGSVTGAIVNTVISVVFAVYCLSRKEILARQCRRLMYSLLPERFTDEVIRIMRLTNSTFSNFISGQCLEACILGCLFAVAMLILKMPYIPLVSVVIAVTALVPVVGAFVGCVLGAFFILVDNPLQAATFVIMFLILQQLENNLIYPRVVGTSIGLPGMWVLVAVTIGGEIMGVGGMLVMIPLVSVLYTLLREFTDKRLVERGISAEKLMEQPPEIKSRFQRSQERRQRRYFLKMREKLRAMQEKSKRE